MNNYLRTKKVQAKYQKILCLVALCLTYLFNSLYAQEHSLEFKHLTIKDGLSQSTGFSMIQDRKGFMWFGTEDGLNRYDGYNFKIFKSSPNNAYSISNNYIYTICEDHQGVLWFGTEGGGINKYIQEKEQFFNYQHDPDDLYSLGSNTVYVIFEDHLNDLWIGTEDGGLNKLVLSGLEPNLIQHNHKTSNNNDFKFIQYKNDINDPKSISHNDVYSICEDHQGFLWIGTSGGLNKFNRNTNKFERYLHDSKNNKSLSNDIVKVVYVDKASTLWIGTDGGGLNKFDSKNKEFIHYKFDLKDPHSLSSNRILTIFEDRSGMLWIGTEGEGLNRFDREKECFIHYKANDSDPNSLSINRIYSICEDQTGILWIGTRGGGINYTKLEAKKFIHYQSDPADQNSLSHNNVWSFCESINENEDVIWIGTLNGLNRFDRAKNQWSRFFNNPYNDNSLNHNNIRAICKDHLGILWVGSDGGGVTKVDFHSEIGEDLKFIRYSNNPKDTKSLSNDEIRSIYEDHIGNVWIGTYGGGLNKYDRDNDNFIIYKNNVDDPFSLSNNFVYTIYEDHLSVLWIGTWRGGLNRFDRDNNRFIRYMNDPDNPKSINNNCVLSIYEDKSNVLWCGTYGSGLNKFDRETETFTHYSEEDGLPNNSIYGILEDKQNILWLSTNKGLSKFNPQTEKFKNFDVNDGLQSNEFNGGAYFRTKRGELLIGGINGFNIFYPDSIRVNAHIPQIKIIDFQIFNKSVPVGSKVNDKIILSKSVTETESIKLSYKDQIFTFEFAALHYAAPEKNEYAFKMEGFEKEWNYVGKRRFATYTNLPTGEYIFRVKGSNNDGLWNEKGTSVRITVSPPFWQRWWFRSMAVMLILLIAFTFYQVRTYNIRDRNKQLEELVSERTNKLQQEIAEHKQTEKALHNAKEAAEEASLAKSEFLANMSHEIRTPMNGIIGMTAIALSSTITPQQQEYLETIKQSADSLLDILNEILDLSKIEANKLEIEEIDFNLLTLIENTIKPLAIQAEKKGLELFFNYKLDQPIFLKSDPVRLRQIIINLVGNAIKFTDKGEIIIHVDIDKDSNNNGLQALELNHLISSGKPMPLKLSVSDTGIGIPENKLNRIFDSFSQADGSTTRKYGGTGLGLTISKKLVDLMGGKIWIKSEEGIGTTFYFSIEFKQGVAEAESFNQIDNVHFKGVRVLIVDDNSTNRMIVREMLSKWGFSFVEAVDGNQALVELEKSDKDNNPFQLVITDFQMPGMNGYELAEKINNHPLYSAIKIILITSFNEKQDIARCKESGVVGYLKKPINHTDLLRTIMNNLYNTSSETEPKEVKLEKVGDWQKLNILLAEDNIINQKVATGLLNKWGHNVEIANNGKEALEKLEEQNFDLVLMDVQMPEMDGLEATYNIRNSKSKVCNPNVPIIAMTARVMEGDRESCLKAGMNDYISKPINVDEFLKVLKKYVFSYVTSAN